jgi:hypothetical protein
MQHMVQEMLSPHSVWFAFLTRGHSYTGNMGVSPPLCGWRECKYASDVLLLIMGKWVLKGRKKALAMV